jgi:hypothetical protein
MLCSQSKGRRRQQLPEIHHLSANKQGQGGHTTHGNESTLNALYCVLRCSKPWTGESKTRASKGASNQATPLSGRHQPGSAADPKLLAKTRQRNCRLLTLWGCLAEGPLQQSCCSSTTPMQLQARSNALTEGHGSNVMSSTSASSTIHGNSASCGVATAANNVRRCMQCCHTTPASRWRYS